MNDMPLDLSQSVSQVQRQRLASLATRTHLAIRVGRIRAGPVVGTIDTGYRPLTAPLVRALLLPRPLCSLRHIGHNATSLRNLRTFRTLSAPFSPRHTPYAEPPSVN